MKSFSPRLIVRPNPADLFHAAAGWFVEEARRAVQERGRCAVALAGGSTPQALYALLASELVSYREQIAWPRLHFFWGDERHVAPDDPASNYRMARESMLSRLTLPAANIHRVHTENREAGAAAAAYEEELRQFFGVHPPSMPRLDVVWLGLGGDGHTASLFPRRPALEERSRWVVADHPQGLAQERITLTFPVINRARAVAFLVTGGGKAEVVCEVLTGPPDPDRLPAQQVRPADGSLLWFLDASAASAIDAASSGTGKP